MMRRLFCRFFGHQPVTYKFSKPVRGAMADLYLQPFNPEWIDISVCARCYRSV